MPKPKRRSSTWVTDFPAPSITLESSTLNAAREPTFPHGASAWSRFTGDGRSRPLHLPGHRRHGHRGTPARRRRGSWRNPAAEGHRVQLWTRGGTHGRRSLRHLRRGLEPEGATGKSANRPISIASNEKPARRPAHLRRRQALQRPHHPGRLPQYRPRGLEAFQARPRPADLVLPRAAKGFQISRNQPDR